MKTVMLTMKNDTHLSIQSFYEQTSTFGYLELEISVAAEDDLYIDGWIGASLRNNLLYAAENINVIGGVSLRQITNILTIKQQHPLYDEMKGGFPKGFGIQLHSHTENLFSCQLKKGEELHFSILLYGHYAEYHTHFAEAVKQLCERGIGNPLKPLHIIHITAKPVVSLSGFIDKKCNEDEREITIRYTVPTNLFHENKHIPGKYIDRQHEFPGFYQLVRSAANRIIRLNALYTTPTQNDLYNDQETLIDPFTQYAVTVILTAAQLKRVELESTPKKGKQERIPFAGYTGELTFEGNFNYYLPLLYFMQNIGVGSNTTYGLGRYEIVKL